MATSRLRFYELYKLQVNKNFIIDDIEGFLDNEGYIREINNFQYLKINLNMTIKISVNQLNLSMSKLGDTQNYLSIKNSDDSRTYYFFITNKIWRSENTIEFQLTMDTLNTFKWDEDYIVNKKTLVLREHKDRAKRYRSYASGSLQIIFGRLVDLKSEGINPPLYKMREEDILDKKDTSWSLMYKNKNDINPSDFNQVNPVECYLMPNDSQRVYYPQTNKILNASDINTGYAQYWFFNPNYDTNESLTFKTSNGTKFGTGKGSRNSWVNFQGVSLKSDGTTIEIRLLKYYRNINGSLSHETIKMESGLTYVEVLNTPMYLKYLFCENSLPNSESELYNETLSILDFSSLQTTSEIDNSSIDRTDSKIIKIINLPYCPTPYEVNMVGGADAISFSSNWEIETTNKRLKLINDFPFENTIIMSSEINPFSIMKIDWGSVSDNDLRNDEHESKIYHSDFYQPKFVYDSFVLPFRCEDLDFVGYWDSRNLTDSEQGLGFEVNFVMTRNIVSKFLFSFPRYITQYGIMDYDNVVCVSRNNEEVLYTSQYINYLRNGYNYDLKSKARYEVASGMTLGASALATIVGLATENPTAIVGGIVGIATSTISYAKNVAEQEQNIQQKLNETRRQSVSVQNADDIDLLTYYSNNRAKMTFYEVSPIMKQALLDMFYYCGYATQEQKVPNISTRIWFNFLQCELVIDETSNLPLYIKDDLIGKFKEGCTFFHSRNSNWDLEQVKENYEIWLF